MLTQTAGHGWASYRSGWWEEPLWNAQECQAVFGREWLRLSGEMSLFPLVCASKQSRRQGVRETSCEVLISYMPLVFFFFLFLFLAFQDRDFSVLRTVLELCRPGWLWIASPCLLVYGIKIHHHFLIKSRNWVIQKWRYSSDGKTGSHLYIVWDLSDMLRVYKAPKIWKQAFFKNTSSHQFSFT